MAPLGWPPDFCATTFTVDGSVLKPSVFVDPVDSLPSPSPGPGVFFFVNTPMNELIASEGAPPSRIHIPGKNRRCMSESQL